MYLRSMKRKNKDGSVAEYIQLAHNYRDPQTKRPKPQILYNFGRREQIDEGTSSCGRGASGPRLNLG